MSIESGGRHERRQQKSDPTTDFEHIFQSGVRVEELEKFPEAKDLVDEVFGIIDTNAFSQEAGNIVEVIEHVRLVVKEQGWRSYDDVQFGKIREELTAAGIPLRDRRTSSDY